MRTSFLRILAILTTLAAGMPISAAVLLDFDRGRKPNHSGYGARTQYALVAHPKLSGRVLRVQFTPGDSIGVNRAGIADWTPFAAIEFGVFNPSSPVQLEFVVRHSGSMGTGSRVAHPIEIVSGVGQVKINLAELRRADGAVPGLRYINHWFIRSPTATAKLYLTSLHLTGTASLKPNPTSKLRAERLKMLVMPRIVSPIDSNTPEADALLSALEVFPADNVWNTAIDSWPAHPNSALIVEKIGKIKPLRLNHHLPFVLIPTDQTLVEVALGEHLQQSDPGPYPVPLVTMIEGWPARDKSAGDRNRLGSQINLPPRPGQRRAIIVDPTRRLLWEFSQMKRSSDVWIAKHAAFFDLKSNGLRREGRQSADAAGLPIFPALIRHDELRRGIVEHAMRFTVSEVRSMFTPPARRSPGTNADRRLPRMGERFRLRADFDLSSFSAPTAAILQGLQMFGMIVADQGEDWTLSTTTDPRIPLIHAELARVRGRDFEVVVPPAN
jgi:hypothetical protein